jgi:tetratricopeptide (TPR) repeat protein
MLDAEELFRLGITEMQRGSTEKAIEYLKKSLEQEHNNAKAIYLLGALHAGLGMYDRAAEEMQQALDMEPNLTTARFQLGLLHFTSGNIAEASEVWSEFDKDGEKEPFFLFKRGILHLAKDNFAECISDLEQGIKINVANEALNNDMRKMITETREALKGATNSKQDIETEDKPNASKNITLAAYENQDSD